MKFLLRWAISAAAVWAAVRLVPGIQIEPGIAPLFVVAAILGAINAVVRPLIKALACGLIFLTLGLFLLVINAVMLLLTAIVAQAFDVQFTVDGFMTALVGSVVISLVSFVASAILVDEE